MSKKNNKPRVSKVGKNPNNKNENKEQLKSRIWTIVFILIIIIIFIVNNTRKEPDKGPYPPNYRPVNIKK